MKSEVHATKGRDWRWVPLLVVLLYLSLTVLIACCRGHLAEQQLLQGLGVPALEYPFMDMRGVAAWCDVWSMGKNPATEQTWITLPDGTRQPGFLMNYSPLVLALESLGLSASHVAVWSVVMIALYLTALWFLCRGCSLQQAFLWLLLVCSPCSVLVMERGNLDMLLFAMLVAALLLRKYPLAESGVILSASLLKFFPIGALVAPWREGGMRNRCAVALAGVGFAVFLLYLGPRLSAIGGSLSGQYQSSFGCVVIADLLHHHGSLTDAGHAIARKLMFWAALAWVVFGGAAGFLSRTSFPKKIDGGTLHSFFLTAPMMIGLFLIGNQMDYKWIFFLPMVPAVLVLLKSDCRLDSVFSKGWLAGILVYSYWTFFSDEGSLRNSLLKQLVMWCVMILTACLGVRLWKHGVRGEKLQKMASGSV